MKVRKSCWPWDEKKGAYLAWLCGVLVRMSEKARREGLLSLEEELAVFKAVGEPYQKKFGFCGERFEFQFFIRMMQLVIDGNDQRELSNIGRDFIGHWTVKHSFERVVCTVVYAGVLALQMGKNPRMLVLDVMGKIPKKYWNGSLVLFLDMYTGEDSETEMNTAYRKEDVKPGILDKLLDDRNATVYRHMLKGGEEEFLFSDIAFVEDRAVQKMLREVDMETLVRALCGAEEGVKNRIYGNMPRRSSDSLAYLVEFRKKGPDELCENEVMAAQKELVNVLRKLRNCGEVS